MVVDDGLLIHENHEKPDYVIVVGGSIKGSFKEMTIGDAELYKENHIRTKLGMERSDESPAREAGIKRTCCICHSRSELRCSVCRTKYCSVSCQKKKDWIRHLFVCRVEKRPRYVDVLAGLAFQKQ